MELLLILKIVLTVVVTVSGSNFFINNNRKLIPTRNTYLLSGFFATLHDIRFDLL
jgi:hypothetical protein